jgi:NAD(P)H-hydrate epimerase
MVAAFLAQGLEAWDAAAIAAWVHGDAGDRLARRAGHSGLLAGELADAVPLSCESLRRDSRALCEAPDVEAEARREERGFSFLLPFPGT